MSVNVGDVFKFNWGKYEIFYARILHIEGMTYYVKINNEGSYLYRKNDFHINYTFSQKLTDEYIINNIIE